MNIKSYFDFELRTTLVYSIVAIVMGYVSFLVNNTAYAALAALVVLGIATYAMRLVWKIKEDTRWWLGNGAIVYLFLWIVVWTIFHNTYILG
jgi:hypothetical protein